MIDSADRRRMEETGVELQQLLDEVDSFVSKLDQMVLIFWSNLGKTESRSIIGNGE